MEKNAYSHLTRIAYALLCLSPWPSPANDRSIPVLKGELDSLRALCLRLILHSTESAN